MKAFVSCEGGPLDGDKVLIDQPTPHVLRCSVVSRLTQVGPEPIHEVLGVFPEPGRPVHTYEVCDSGHFHYAKCDLAR